MDAVKNLEFSVNDEWKKLIKQYPWMFFVPEEAKDSEGNEYQRKRGGSVIYQKVEEGYKCVTCGSEIQYVEVIRPIWDGPFACSGSGQTAKEFVPYCPKCEQRPSVHGTPIQIGNPRLS
jgi:hypothetical protein